MASVFGRFPAGKKVFLKACHVTSVLVISCGVIFSCESVQAQSHHVSYRSGQPIGSRQISLPTPVTPVPDFRADALTSHDSTMLADRLDRKNLLRQYHFTYETEFLGSSGEMSAMGKLRNSIGDDVAPSLAVMQGGPAIVSPQPPSSPEVAIIHHDDKELEAMLWRIQNSQSEAKTSKRPTAPAPSSTVIPNDSGWQIKSRPNIKLQETLRISESGVNRM